MKNLRIAEKKIVLVSHHPRELSKSPCVSVYNLFVASTAPYQLYHFLDTTDLTHTFDSEWEKVKNEPVTYLFNGMVSMASENSLKVLRHAVRHRNEIIVYWHETAWNMRFFFQKYKQYLDEAKCLLTIGNTTHWSPTLQLQQILLYVFGCPRGRIKVVFETMPMAAIPLRDRSAARRGDLILASAGIPDKRKGADLFIALSQKFIKFQDRGVRHFWYAARESRTHFPEQGDHGRVEWKGCDPNFQNRLLECDAFLMMSRDDPSPIVCLEAMSCDVPVFCFDTIGYAEILPNDFVCRNLTDMTEKVHLYFANPLNWPVGFFRAIAEQYTPDKFAAKLYEEDPGDDANLPLYEQRDIYETAAGIYLKLAEAKEAQRVAEEKLKLRLNMIGQEIQSIRGAARQSVEQQFRSQVAVVEEQRTKLAQTQAGLAAANSELSQEQRFLLEAHRAARMELKALLRPRKARVERGRAVVVGNSPSVLHDELGSQIDACDVVIRLNNFQLNGFEANVGRRTDKVFLSIACQPNPNLDALSPADIYAYLADRHADRTYAQMRMNRDDGCKVDLSQVNHLSPTLYYYGLKILIGLRERQWPSIGVVALQWAIDNLGKKCDIYYHGFSFFEESDDRLKHYFAIDTTRDGHHDFVKERLYVARLEAEGKIEPLKAISATPRATKVAQLVPREIGRKSERAA